VLTEAAYSSTYYPWPTNKDGARNYVRDTGQVRRNMHVTVYVVADIPPYSPVQVITFWYTLCRSVRRSRYLPITRVQVITIWYTLCRKVPRSTFSPLP
jgi:hypothetical protein